MPRSVTVNSFHLAVILHRRSSLLPAARPRLLLLFASLVTLAVRALTCHAFARSSLSSNHPAPYVLCSFNSEVPWTWTYPIEFIQLFTLLFINQSAAQMDSLNIYYELGIFQFEVCMLLYQ